LKSFSLKNIVFIIVFGFILANLCTNTALAQLIRQDDFQVKNDYWYWRSDGNQSVPYVEDGLLKLKLNNAVDSFYCNTEIYDPTKPYLPGTKLRIRLKSSQMHFGSRGWGFWDNDRGLDFLIDYDVAWVMQQASEEPNPNFNWFLFGANGDSLTNRQTFDLSSIVDETMWHTYEINWEIGKVSFYIDGEFIFESLKYIPDEEMRLDIWIDNRVVSLDDPLDQQQFNTVGSELLVDFVELSDINGPGIMREKSTNILLWDSPNSFPNGEQNIIWKNYNFNAAYDGELLLYITGGAESYGEQHDDDDLKLIVDEIDYGWDTENSFNGNELRGRGKTISLPLDLSRGTHQLQLVTDITPYIRDVIILHSESGEVLFNNTFNENPGNKEGLWKSIEFDIEKSLNVTFLISGRIEGNDSLRIELDNNNGWKSIDLRGKNGLVNTPSTVLITESLDSGTHSLRLYSKGNPEIYNIAAYGSSILTNLSSSGEDKKRDYIKVHPNPFNISANITYSTSIQSHNRIKIVNILGEVISTLVNEIQPKGEYSVIWNSVSQTSGIYFCIFESDDLFEVRKILLLK
jgi:hypothetical protein